MATKKTDWFLIAFVLVFCMFCEIFVEVLAAPDVHHIILKYRVPRSRKVRHKPRRPTRRPSYESVSEESFEDDRSTSVMKSSYHNVNHDVRKPYKFNDFDFNLHSKEDLYNSASYSNEMKHDNRGKRYNGNANGKIPIKYHNTFRPMRTHLKRLISNIEFTTIRPQKLPEPIIESNLSDNYYHSPNAGLMMDGYLPSESKLNPKIANFTGKVKKHRGYEVHENVQDEVTSVASPVLNAFIPVIDPPVASLPNGLKVEETMGKTNATLEQNLLGNKNSKTKRGRGQAKFFRKKV